MVHGLTPPGVASTGPDGGIRAEFSTADKDLSVSVSLPSSGGAVPPVPEPPKAPAEAPGNLSKSPDTGRIFGGYELVAKIGQGGMGEVYKARQVSLDRVVAIKILSKALYDNDEFIKRFEREAKAIARITHPNIVGVYDFGSVDGLRFMVNEFVDGNSLAKLISDRLLLPPSEVVTYLVQCLSGLSHVAAHGIIHRDIKPDNILITKDGVAKIADFGLAKDASGKDEHTDLTAVGLAMGTPAYMSPEQCMGQKLDARTDLYAFGVTAYFALTGQKPFTGGSSFEIMTKQREHTPTLPHELVPGIPRELSTVIMRMLAKKMDDRYPDPEACRQAWIEIGIQIGVFGRNEFETGRTRSGTERPALVPLPQAPTPSPSRGSDLFPVQTAPTAPASTSTRRPSSGEIPAARAPAPSSSTKYVNVPEERVGSERHGSGRANRRPAESATCALCGNLNRTDAAVCSRCGNSLKAAGDAAGQQQQEAEAQRFFDAKRHAEAASIWSRLADREQDKRSRSILRSKEREARRLEHDGKITELRTRAQAVATRGDLRGALTMLEQGRELRGDSSASTTSSSIADVQLEREIMLLRQRLARRRRLYQFGVLFIVLAIAALAIFAVRNGWLRGVSIGGTESGMPR